MVRATVAATTISIDGHPVIVAQRKQLDDGELVTIISRPSSL